MQNARDKALDIASGFCLVVVIAGHVICSIPTSINLFYLIDICCFYLAFFFFRSGIMYHPVTIVAYLRKALYRLLIPYVVFSLIGIFVFCALYPDGIKTEFFSILTYGAPMGNLAIWFLLSLYLCKLLITIRIGFNSNNKFLFVDLILLILLFGFSQLYIPIFNDLPNYSRNMLIGMIFIYWGYILKDKLKKPSIVAMSCIGYILILFLYPSHLNIFEGKPITGNFFTGLLIESCGCVVLYNLAGTICNTRLGCFLEWLGRNSMSFFCFHWIIIFSVVTYFRPVCSTMTLYFLCIISLVVILPIFHRFVSKQQLKWIIGDK